MCMCLCVCVCAKKAVNEAFSMVENYHCFNHRFQLTLCGRHSTGLWGATMLVVSPRQRRACCICSLSMFVYPFWQSCCENWHWEWHVRRRYQPSSLCFCGMVGKHLALSELMRTIDTMNGQRFLFVFFFMFCWFIAPRGARLLGRMFGLLSRPTVTTLKEDRALERWSRSSCSIGAKAAAVNGPTSFLSSLILL